MQIQREEASRRIAACGGFESDPLLYFPKRNRLSGKLGKRPIRYLFGVHYPWSPFLRNKCAVRSYQFRKRLTVVR